MQARGAAGVTGVQSGPAGLPVLPCCGSSYLLGEVFQACTGLSQPAMSLPWGPYCFTCDAFFGGTGSQSKRGMPGADGNHTVVGVLLLDLTVPGYGVTPLVLRGAWCVLHSCSVCSLCVFTTRELGSE